MSDEVNEGISELKLPEAPLSVQADNGQVKAVKEQRYPVMEIFGPTLQGEGQMAGYQTMFIRFGGCDYRCKMCDSLHAVLPSEIKKGARWMTAKDIAFELQQKAGHCDVVTFSGGNPCMWDLRELTAILQGNMRIAVETQGTIYQDWLRDCHWVTISPKGPGMGEKFELDKFEAFGRALMATHTRQHVSVKVVLFDQRDIEFAKGIAFLLQDSIPLYLSVGNPYPPNNPNVGIAQYDEDFSLVQTLLGRMKVLWEDVQQEPLLKDAIFLPQIHVLLWGNELGR